MYWFFWKKKKGRLKMEMVRLEIIKSIAKLPFAHVSLWEGAPVCEPHATLVVDHSFGVGGEDDVAVQRKILSVVTKEDASWCFSGKYANKRLTIRRDAVSDLISVEATLCDTLSTDYSRRIKFVDLGDNKVLVSRFVNRRFSEEKEMDESSSKENLLVFLSHEFVGVC